MNDIEVAKASQNSLDPVPLVHSTGCDVILHNLWAAENSSENLRRRCLILSVIDP